MQLLQPQSLLQLYNIDVKDLLRHVNCVLVPVQEALRSQLLEIYHDYLSGGYWGQDKILNLIQRSFTWPEIVKDISEYIIIYLIY
jgi:Integrase zinc binding domain